MDHSRGDARADRRAVATVDLHRGRVRARDRWIVAGAPRGFPHRAGGAAPPAVPRPCRGSPAVAPNRGRDPACPSQARHQTRPPVRARRLGEMLGATGRDGMEGWGLSRLDRRARPSPRFQDASPRRRNWARDGACSRLASRRAAESRNRPARSGTGAGKAAWRGHVGHQGAGWGRCRRSGGSPMVAGADSRVLV